MDPSEFSLEKAEVVIRPHLKQLSFKRFEDYIQDTQCSLRGYENIVMRTWLGHIFVPYGLDRKDYMYLFSVSQNPAFYPTNRKLKSIMMNSLLLHRTTSGGVFGHWYFYQGLFLESGLRNSGILELSRGSIVPVDDKNFSRLVTIPKDFSKKFWLQVRVWVENSRKARQEVIEGLNALETRCGEIELKTTP